MTREMEPQGQEPTRRRVLVVDDDEAARDVFCRMLGAKYNVDSAASGDEARAFIESRTYDAVLSDVTMPGIDGIQLLKQLHERDPDLPVVLVTGAPHVRSAIEAVDYGAFRYLVKPIGAAELGRAVDSAVQLRELTKFREEAVSLFGRDRNVLDRATLRTRFDAALNDLYMLYQPIVNVKDRSVFAYEALVRSRSRFLSHPLALLDAAETLGAVVELGRRIRRRVADDLQLMPSPSTIFVNLHPAELLDEELYHEGAPLAPFADRVVLEITERSRLENVSDLGDRVARLSELGFRLAIDDLGAGYAGLTSIVSLDPSFVKVDMTLVRDVGSKPKSQRLLQSILDLGREIGLHVILEGIETRDEAETLVGMGAVLLQGYYFGRPAPLGHSIGVSPAPPAGDSRLASLS